jgi:hypothetical protein
LLDHWELSLEQTSKAISNWGDILNPANQGLRQLQVL